ncbi:MAG: TerB family tellurite resistance protein [Bacteroidetes bacterium]|nr:TerB family tellurite resistance protein [Bacteroidota bacterium]
MTPLENLHYAIGQLAYTVASADGAVQPQERKKFHDIVAAELRCNEYDFNVSDIIFRIMDKDKWDTETTYNWAMKEIKLNSHYLSPALKKSFISVMEKIAKAFSIVTDEEKNIIERFKKDIEFINGDPIFYGKEA